MRNRVDVASYNRHVGGWGNSDARQINTKLQKSDPAIRSVVSLVDNIKLQKPDPPINRCTTLILFA